MIESRQRVASRFQKRLQNNQAVCHFRLLLAGSIPKELGALSALEQLDLRNNQLTGEFILEGHATLAGF